MVVNMNIERIVTINDLKKIEPLIKAYQFKPYYFLKGVKEKDINALFAHQLAKATADRSNFLLTATEKNKPAGFVLLERMAWDSSFFGFECYAISHLSAEVGKFHPRGGTARHILGSALSICKEKNVRYLHAKVDAEDTAGIRAYESLGFSLVSIMLPVICYTKQARRHFKVMGAVRPWQKKDLKNLREIARNSMRFDHFHSDPHFSKRKSDSVYEALIENCCKGRLADKVFVVEKKGGVAGYAACLIRRDVNNILPIKIGSIRHLAVKQPQGFGCGPGLQETALNWFESRVDVVESATTIENLGILKISLKSGMDIVAPYLRFAKWLF